MQDKRRSRSYAGGERDSKVKFSSPRAGDHGQGVRSRPSQSSTRNSQGGKFGTAPSSPGGPPKPALRRSSSNDQCRQNGGRPRPNVNGLPPIPGSPQGTDTSSPGTPNSCKSTFSNLGNGKPSRKQSSDRSPANENTNGDKPTTPPRNRSKSSSNVPRKSPPVQSLSAAVEMFSLSEQHNKRSTSDSSHIPTFEIPDVPRVNLNGAPGIHARTQIRADLGTPPRDNWTANMHAPPSPSRPVPALPTGGVRSWSGKGGAGIGGKDISTPVLNHGTRCLFPTRLLLFNFRYRRGNYINESRPKPNWRPTYPSRTTAKTCPQGHGHTRFRVCS